jgi:hypothetical protein
MLPNQNSYRKLKLDGQVARPWRHGGWQNLGFELDGTLHVGARTKSNHDPIAPKQSTEVV